MIYIKHLQVKLPAAVPVLTPKLAILARYAAKTSVLPQSSATRFRGGFVDADLWVLYLNSQRPVELAGRCVERAVSRQQGGMKSW